MPISPWIQTLRDRLFNNIRRSLSFAYLEHHDADITREVDARLSREIPGILHNHTHAIPLVNGRPVRTTTVNRVRTTDATRQAYESDVEYRRSSLRNDVGDEYRQHFQALWNTRIKAVFEAEFEKINTLENGQSLEDEFFEQHPWMCREPGSHGLAAGFFAEFFADHFYNDSTLNRWIVRQAMRLAGGRCEPWGSVSLRDLESPQNLSWHPVDSAARSKAIRSYPLSNIKAQYLENLQRAYPSFLSVSDSNGSTILHRLTRIDMLRFLWNTYADNSSGHPMAATLADGVATTKIMPIDKEELLEGKLTTAQLNHADTLLVNIAPPALDADLAGRARGASIRHERERQTQWILLKKESNVWRAYVPAHLEAACAPAITQLTSHFRNNMPVTHVDCTENLRANDIQNLDDWMAWQAILLGRVLPGCRTDVQNRTVENHHATTPLPLLYQQVFAKTFMPSRGTNRSNDHLNRAFGRRQPITTERAATWYEIPDTRLSSNAWMVDDDDAIVHRLCSEAHVDESLAAFANGHFKLDNEQKRLMVTHDATQRGVSRLNENQTIDALSLLLHHNIPKLVVNRVMPWSYESFNYTTDLKIVMRHAAYQPINEAEDAEDNSCFNHIFSCAARNRFLESFSEETLNDARRVPSERGRLWQKTGERIINFYETQKGALALDFVLNLKAAHTEWLQSRCDHEAGMPEFEKEAWEFMQIAQMGTKGLDVLFRTLDNQYVSNWNNVLKEPAPNLSMLLDLSGHFYEAPKDYIGHLNRKIEDFGLGYRYTRRAVAPLFESLAFMMPQRLNSAGTALTAVPLDEYQDELTALIRTLDSRAKRYPTEVQDFDLHVLENNADSDAVLTLLETLANDAAAPLTLLVHMPHWDRTAFDTEDAQRRKARYRALQNKILDNQRLREAETLANNQTEMVNWLERVEPDEPVIDVAQQLEALPWEGDDVVYQLASAVPGLQQQQQQEQMQEQEEEEEEEQDLEVSLELQTNWYLSNDVVTRDTIADDERCQDFWAAVALEQKDLSGDKGEGDLRALFSQWVGSDQNASEVIRYIEHVAVERILSQPSKFRLGLSKDNLPPGFYLEKNGRDDGLLLRFSKEREVNELSARKRTALKNQNPFTVVLHEPQKPQIFSGDYRQFDVITNDETAQQTLWKYCALEDADPVRMSQAWGYLNAEDEVVLEDDASVMMQRIDVHGVRQAPGGFADALAALQAWGDEAGAEAVAELLFNAESEQALSIANLKAFGQLFNHYDTTQGDSGTKAWLTLAKEVHAVFGEVHFATWKNRLLNPSLNWTECLDKTELDAMTDSFRRLENKRELQAVWWALVDRHGAAVGQFPYAELWHAFSRCLNYIEQKELTVNHEAILTYLAQYNETPDFNGQVFLDRLHRVLRLLDKKPDAEFVQQDILDNLHLIDWRHNGAYYACRYQDYPYWDESLALDSFKMSSRHDTATYRAQWEWHHSSHVNKLHLHTLRFAAQKMQMPKNQFYALKEILAEVGHDVSAEKMRLFIASLALGVDKAHTMSRPVKPMFDAFDAVSSSTILNLNSLLGLTGDLQDATLHMRFENLGLFARLLQAHQTKIGYTGWGAAEKLEFINRYGRACEAVNCMARLGQPLPSKEDFMALLFNLKTPEPGRWWGETLVQDGGANNLILASCPWLLSFDEGEAENQRALMAALNSYQHEVGIFGKQLQSIDFSTSTYLPTAPELQAYIQRIADAPYRDAERTRREIVRELIAKGCHIRSQNARFAPLTAHQAEDAHQALTARVKKIFRDENRSLCERFYTECVAIDTRRDAENQCARLTNVLIRLDNKKHFNELGQILGTLIQMSRDKTTGRQKLYSAPQLVAWLEALLDADRYENQHYPTRLLESILSTDVTRSLLSDALEDLSTSGDDALKRRISGIACSALPNQYKPFLIDLTLQDTTSGRSFSERAKMAFSTLHGAPVNGDADERVSTRYLDAAERLLSMPQLRDLWPSEQEQLYRALFVTDFMREETQVELIDFFIAGHVSLEDLERDFNLNDGEQRYLKRILVKAMAAEFAGITEENKNHVRQRPLACVGHLKPLFRDFREKRLLAEYYDTIPAPSLQALIALLRQAPRLETARDVIHQFEAVQQGLDKDGRHKRNYSITENDQENLIRVLAGFKRKTNGFVKTHEQTELLNLLYYTNQYSQVKQLRDLYMDDLLVELRAAQSRIQNAANPHARATASVEMLACMREIVLRKTGKWAHHTQMLDLIYAALHNDEGLIHQVRTGQGKSIITLMRTAYIALNGDIVDVFSAKDSLSQRDHEEFAPVFTAMGIRNAYITPKSDAEAYHDQLDEHGTGAVNYMTVCNFSLYQSSHIWKADKDISYERARRVAFLDEADHILLDETTQANFSDSGSDTGVYNMDEWVYRAAYDYYMANKDTFTTNADGVLTVRRNTELKALCEHLQSQVVHAPKASNFVSRYLTPSRDGDERRIKRRDEKLKQLLTAAHIASGLKNNVDYCVLNKPEYKTITKAGGDKMEVPIRFAKVMINSQVREGSTYSDLVQQFLHVRLNKDAIAKGEKPNFFVEPASQIALSQNAPYLLKKYYHKLEGCTGTAGGSQDVATYADEYGLNHIIKLPTHEPLSSVFLPATYCQDEASQIKGLADVIRARRGKGPILVTCKDDVAVEHMTRLLTAAGVLNLISDTNAKGIRENDVVNHHSYKANAVTVSSRMGRGTDIKPETEAGLMVLRTYPAIDRVSKQELGRQGRNGRKGTCQDIINYGAVLASIDRLHGDRFDEFNAIRAYEVEHLEEKLTKHARNARQNGGVWLKPAFKALADDETKREQYLNTRALMRFKHKEKLRHDRFLHNKEAFIAECTGHIKDALREAMAEGASPHTLEALKLDWMETRQAIDALWSVRLSQTTATPVSHDGVESKSDDSDSSSPSNVPIDEEEAYERFIELARLEWGELALRYPRIISSEPLQFEAEPATFDVTAVRRADATDIKAIPEVVQCYQHWVNGADQVFFAPDNEDTLPAQNVLNALYRKNAEPMGGLQAFYQRFKVLSDLDIALRARDAGATTPNLQALLQKLSHLSRQYHTVYAVPYRVWSEILEDLQHRLDDEHFLDYLERMEDFLRQDWLMATPPYALSVDEIEKRAALFRLVMRSVYCAYQGAEDIEQIECFIGDFSEVVHEHFWESFTGEFAESIDALFTTHPRVTRLLMSHTNRADLGLAIELYHAATQQHRAALLAYLNAHEEDFVARPHTLMPTMRLVLTGEQVAIPEAALPERQSLLPNWPQAEESRVWDFLTHRPSVDRNATHQLVQPLSQLDLTDPAVLQSVGKMVDALVAVPTYVPLGYVAHTVRFEAGRFTQANYVTRLESVRVAGRAFCNFMERRGVITSAIEYQSIPVAQRETFNSLVQQFTSMTPAKNREFFAAMALEDALDMPWVQCFMTAYADERINNPAELTEAIALARMIQTVGEGDARTFLEETFRHVLDTTASASMQPTVRRLREFTEAMQGVVMQRVAIEKLKEVWERNEISTQTELKNAIRVTKLAEALQSSRTDAESWRAYFSYARCNRQQDRQALMQHLEHGLISLGPDFENRCYREYKDLIHDTFVMPDASLSLEARSTEMQKNYAAVISLVREIEVVGQHPYPHTAATAHELGEEHINTRYNTYFDAQEARYNNCWWKNSARQAQAEQFFKHLRAQQTKGYDNGQYYLETLKLITRAQRSLLSRDFDANRSLNTKGYSRLYDIMDEVFLTVARDCLEDWQVSFDDKASIQAMLQEQLVYQTNLLRQRLPESHDLKARLENLCVRNVDAPFEARSTELYSLKTTLETLDRTTVPKELHYLLKNLDCLVRLGDPEGSASPIDRPYAATAA